MERDEQEPPVEREPIGSPPVPEDGIDFDHANAARIYDYLLGGAHNFAVDRELAEQIRAANPDLPRQARANRAFLRRVVQWCTSQGIDQDDPEFAARLRAAAEQYRTSATPGTVRTRAEITAFLDGFEIVPPGLVDLVRWPAPTDDEPIGVYAAVGRLR